MLLLVLCACSSVGSRTPAPSTAEYIPSFERIPKGYRPYLPHYSPEVTYRYSQDTDGMMLADIQEQFARPLVAFESSSGVRAGKYHQLIGAIVVNFADEAFQSDFTIWLLDGQRLESGPIWRIDEQRLDSGILLIDQATGGDIRGFDPHHMGHAMYVRAMKVLREAIPESKLRAAAAAMRLKQ